MKINTVTQILLGAATLVLAAGFLIRSIPQAQARFGPVVSYGANPIWSKGGTLNGDLITALQDDLVVTDLQLSLYSDDVGDCWFTKEVVLTTPSLGTVAEYTLTWIHDISSGGGHIDRVDAHFVSGLRIPAGETLSASVSTPSASSCSNHDVRYTLSGYHAHTP